MKTLTQAWELIQLLSSLRLLSPTLVRVSSPQNYTFYCSYDPNRRYLSVGIHNIFTHIDICEEESCEYYICRIKKNKVEKVWGGGVASGSIAGLGAALAPLTFGISTLVSIPLSFASDYVISGGLNENLKAIENELKLKWENEQAGQNSTSETASETSDSEVNSEIREEEEAVREEPRPWWDNARETAENEVENETNYSESVRGEHGETVRPDTTVFTTIPREERLAMGQILNEWVEQSGGRNEFALEIESTDTNFSYFIRARRARRRRDN